MQSEAEAPGVVEARAAHQDQWRLRIEQDQWRFSPGQLVIVESVELDADRWTVVDRFRMPRRARHGSVLPLSRAEYDALLRAWGLDAFAEES